MRYVSRSVLLLISAALAGCAPAQYTAEKWANDLRDNIHVTSDRIEKWATTPPPGPGPRHAIAPSYCYHVLQDILCYRQPMPGWEHRLAGYQGTGAPAPPPAMMEPLAMRDSTKTAPQAASKVASAQPVFVNMPTGIAAAEKEPESPEQAVDPSHEQLPDPALAPQL